MSALHPFSSNAAGAVGFAPADGYALVRWTSAAPGSAAFRALYEHTANLVGRHRLVGLLADHRVMSEAPDSADQQWLLAEWLPAVLAGTGLARYAVLMAPAYANRLHTPDVAQHFRDALPTAVFAAPEEAVAWLRQPPDSFNQPL